MGHETEDVGQYMGDRRREIGRREIGRRETGDSRREKGEGRQETIDMRREPGDWRWGK